MATAPIKSYACGKGHALLPMTRLYDCDICHARVNGVSLCCLTCNYDACPTHHLSHTGVAKDAKDKFVLGMLKCAKGHPLVMETRGVSWICDCCNAPRNAGEVSAFCSSCDYDECLCHRVMLAPSAPVGLRTKAGLNLAELTPSEAEDAKMRSLLLAVQSSTTAAPRYFDAFAPTTVVPRPISTKVLPVDPKQSWGIGSSMWTKPSVYEAPYISILNDPQAQAVFIQSCEIDASVCAFLARCTVTFTFRNNSSRALEGELVFPLPEEAVISGYSLEVEGELVPASLVEAKQAEKIYEAEVKKGVDPGLVQKVAAGGNVFKTRVYPLPQNGTRRLSVTYTQPLDQVDAGHGGFTFSVAFSRPVALKLHSQILSPLLPVVDGNGCNAAKLTQDGSGAFMLGYENASHSGADSVLRVVVPLADPNAPSVVVEKAAESSEGWYFAISDVSPPSEPFDFSLKKNRTAILWDASLSRLDANLSAEMEALGAILQRVGGTAIDVFVVRNQVEVFEGLSPSDALALLRETPNDGATSLQELDRHLAPRLDSYDRILLFSDGQSTVGEGRVPCIERGASPPVFCLASSARLNYSHLQHYWASCTGGAVLRVGRQSTEEIAAAVFLRAPQVVSVQGAAVDANPQAPKSISGGRFVVTGRIPPSSKPDAEGNVAVVVALGRVEARSYSLNVARASVGANVVQMLWAQQRIAELEVFHERNHDEILSIGRKYSIVTASTSLLVLETLAQHLEHNVVPNPLRTKLYQEYLRNVKSVQSSEDARVASKLATVRGYWAQRTSWYSKNFSGPSKSPEKMKKTMSGADRLCRCECEAPAMACAAPMAFAPQRVMLGAAAPCAQACCVDDLFGAPCASAPCPPPGQSSGGPAPSSAARTTGATVKYWTPDTPYLRAISSGASLKEQYGIYLSQRPEYVKTPAFYFDVAAFFLNPKAITPERRDIGIRVLSTIAELGLENSRVLRVLGYKLHESKEYELASEVFCRVALYRPTEPQSYRDLALTFLERGWHQAALDLLWRTITMEVPSSFAEIEVEALWEIRDCLARAKRSGVPVELPEMLKSHEKDFLSGDMPLDLRVTMGWDQDSIDLDLHVIEPTGEEAYYGHKETEIGGLMSRDFTQGYGPESYVLKKGWKGLYRFKTNYFASHQPQLTGPTVAILTITTNFCRPEQQTATTLIRLNENKDNGEIGSVLIE